MFTRRLIKDLNVDEATKLVEEYPYIYILYGIYTSNYKIRMDTDSSVLHYAQRPLVTTDMNELIKYDKHPAGQNIVLAISEHDGYNMEDAIVINKSSTQRGLFRSTYYRPYKTEALRSAGGQIDKIEIVDKDVKGYRTEKAYRHLEEDGIIYPEANVIEDEVLIGKTSPPRFLPLMFLIVNLSPFLIVISTNFDLFPIPTSPFFHANVKFNSLYHSNVKL